MCCIDGNISNIKQEPRFLPAIIVKSKTASCQLIAIFRNKL